VKITNSTQKLLDLLLKIASTAKDNNKDYFIGGGFAIDLSVGKITRNHHDIDFHPMLKDYSWWQTWFKDQNYQVDDHANENFTEISKIIDEKGKEIVDMWPFKLVKDKLLIKYQGIYIDSERCWSETRTVVFQGVEVVIENPLRVLHQKLRHAKKGQKLRPQDIHDIKLLNQDPKLLDL